MAGRLARSEELARARRAARLLGVILLALLLAAVACDDDDGDDPDGPTASPTPSAMPVETATPAPQPSPSPSGSPAPTPAPGPTLQFRTTGGDTVTLVYELADEPQERTQGLMFRESLPENAGMLFDFGGDTNSGFWMRNTLIPLSIAFITADGTIIHIEDMEPLTENLHFAPGPYRYAVEVNQGWYADKGVAVGDRMELS